MPVSSTENDPCGCWVFSGGREKRCTCEGSSGFNPFTKVGEKQFMGAHNVDLGNCEHCINLREQDGKCE